MTRKIFLSISVIAILATFGCKRAYNYGLDQQVSKVTNLFAPQDSLYVQILPATGAPIQFQWAAAHAQDGSLVQYEIAFDTAGDPTFQHPVFKIASDGIGVENQATLTQSQLNQIAYMAGIPSLGTGNLYWTVYSTKGLNEIQASQSKMITVQRPAGFAVIPASLYLTGSATEGGANLASAIPFKQTSSGVFELYTSLKKGGTYQFTDRTTANPTTYYFNVQALAIGGSNTYSDTTAQVRFNLDFNNAVGSITVIRSVDIWYAYMDTIPYHLSYAGNSIWADSSQYISFPQAPWGLDDRYKFQFRVNYGGGTPDAYEWYGSVNFNNNNEPNSSTALSFWYLVPVTNDQWAYTFKFEVSNNNNVYNNITLFMQPTGPYTHIVAPK